MTTLKLPSLPCQKLLPAIVFLFAVSTAHPVVLKLKMVDVRHDGYCFYHSLSELLNNGESGYDLHIRLLSYLSQTSALQNPALEASLNNNLIASNVHELTSQLINHFPSSGPQGWAGLSEAVAMSHLLGQPILVLHIGASQQISADSFLVNHEGIYPLGSLQGSSLPVPQLQLILSGSEWHPIMASETTESWSQGLGFYLSQLANILSEHLQGVGNYIALNDVDSNSHDGAWMSTETESLDGDIVMLDQGSIQVMARLEFSCWWQCQMKIYRAMKSSIVSAQQQDEEASDSWYKKHFQVFSLAADNLTTMLTSAVSWWLASKPLSDYLLLTHLSISAFFESLLPSMRSAWDMLSTLRPLVDQSSLQAGGLSFDSSCRRLLTTSQRTGATLFPTKNIAQHVDKIVLPSGRVHPDSIATSNRAIVIPFDSRNPLHHLLFSLYIISQVYNLLDHCLNVSLSLSPEQLAQHLGAKDGKEALIMLSDQRQLFKDVVYRIHALIHALGRQYFPEFWQDGHYDTITICDGNFIIFHSDDFAPRGGWRDMLPQ